MKSLRNPNRKPTHPGAVLREDVLPETGWTQTELASRLMVSRQTVSDLLHCMSGRGRALELASHATGSRRVRPTKVKKPLIWFSGFFTGIFKHLQ